MNKTFFKQILWVVLFLIPSTYIFTQETKIETTIVYTISGPTKVKYLERKLGIENGNKFNTELEAEVYGNELKQKFENLRIFEEVDVIYKNNTFYVNLKEALSIIPIPFPKFNSETGGRIGLKVYWNNTLGTLTNTLLQGGINLEIDPITDKPKITTWDSNLNLSGVLLFNRYFNISANQNLNRSSKDNTNWTYNTTNISASTSFSPFKLLKNIGYSTSLSATANYNYGATTPNEYKTPFSIGFSHSLGSGNINWIDNFRNGYSFSIGNSISLTISDSNILNTGFSGTATYFYAKPNLPIAFGTKLTGSISLNGEMLGLGSNIRGVKSGDMYGDAAIFSINNIYIRTIKIPGLAEAIFGPHFDMGITNYLKPKFGTGADFILYVDKLKSLVARGTISVDLGKLEPVIDITSSLFF